MGLFPKADAEVLDRTTMKPTYRIRAEVYIIAGEFIARREKLGTLELYVNACSDAHALDDAAKKLSQLEEHWMITRMEQLPLGSDQTERVIISDEDRMVVG